MYVSTFMWRKTARIAAVLWLRLMAFAAQQKRRNHAAMFYNEYTHVV